MSVSGNMQALEQGHGHYARQVAGHTEARYQEQDGDSPRPEPAHKLLDRRDDRCREAGMVATHDEIGLGLGRENGG